MTPFARTFEALKASNAEVRDVLKLRKLQADTLVGLSGVVFPALVHHPYEKGLLKEALSKRSASLDPFYRGLFIIAISSFERFIKHFFTALVQKKATTRNRFSEFDEAFRHQYISRAGRVLTNVGSGTVKGAPYNFTTLQSNLGVCLIDTNPPVLNGEIYTLFMGNPRSSSIESILEALGIERPFDQAFGSHSAMKSWGKQAGWASILVDAKQKVEKLMDDRNLIVHAAQPISIVEQDVEEACDFFESFAHACVDTFPARL